MKTLARAILGLIGVFVVIAWLGAIGFEIGFIAVQAAKAPVHVFGVVLVTLSAIGLAACGVFALLNAASDLF